MRRARFGATVWLWVWLGLTGCDDPTRPDADLLGPAPAEALGQMGVFAADGVQPSALVDPCADCAVGWRHGLREAAEVLARVGALSTNGAGGAADVRRAAVRDALAPRGVDIGGPIAFGPCHDCFWGDAPRLRKSARSGGSAWTETAAVVPNAARPHRAAALGASGGAEIAGGRRRAAPEFVVDLPEHLFHGFERFGQRPPADDIETGVGPVGFGPCADCVQLFVKRDDVLPGVTDLSEVGKVEVQILTVDGRSTELELRAPPSELAWHPADGPLLRIDLPFDQLKRFVLWQVGSVRAEVQVTAGGSAQWVSFEAGVRRTEVYVGGAAWVAPEVDANRVDDWVPYAQSR